MRFRTPNFHLMTGWTEENNQLRPQAVGQWYDTIEEVLDARRNPAMAVDLGYLHPGKGTKVLKLLNAVYPAWYMEEIHTYHLGGNSLVKAHEFIAKLKEHNDYNGNWLYYFTLEQLHNQSNLYIRVPTDTIYWDEHTPEDWDIVITSIKEAYGQTKSSNAFRITSGKMPAFVKYNFLRKVFLRGNSGTEADYYTFDGQYFENSRILGYVDSNSTFSVTDTNRWTNCISNTIWKMKYTYDGPVRRERLYTTFSYSTNVMNILGEKFISEPKEFKPPFYGVELEMSTDYSQRDLIDATEEPFFILKSDSSISGNKSRVYELVTLPMSIVAHKKRFAHFFSNLDYDTFDRSITTTNGMHVHISRAAFNDTKGKDTESHLRKFSYFFINPSNYQFLLAVSERTEDSLQRFSPIPRPSTHDIANHKALFKQSTGCWGRGAINVTSGKPTVEVRLFKGIVSYATIVKNLEFTDSVFFFTQQATRSTLTLHHYLNWLKLQPANKYKTLREFYRRINVTSFVKESNLLEEIFRYGFDQTSVIKALSDVNTVLKQERKISLSLMHNVAKCIKRVIPQFSYVYNKRTGMFEKDTRNLSKLHDLDVTLEKLFKKNKQKGEKFSVPTTPEPNEPPTDEVETGTLFEQMRTSFNHQATHEGISPHEDIDVARGRVFPPPSYPSNRVAYRGRTVYLAENLYWYYVDTGAIVD